MTAIKKLNYNKINLDKISQRIKTEIETRNLSYATLGRLTKISSETIRKLCQGSQPNPTINTLEAIANALNIDIFDLLGSHDAMTIIEEKTIPLYHLNNLTDIKNNIIHDKITCLVKGSDNCFAIKVDTALENILIESNSLFVDSGDVLIFDKEHDPVRIKSRTIVIYLSNNGLSTLGEVIGNDENGQVYVSQRKSLIKNTIVEPIELNDIIAILAAVQYF